MREEFDKNAPKARYAYVVCLADSSVSVIDLISFEVIETIPVGEVPWDIAITTMESVLMLQLPGMMLYM